MNISKHHQIVIFSVGAIVTIFCLHFLVFSEKNRSYSEAKASYDAAAGELAQLRIVSDQNKLKEFTTWTQQALGELSKGLKLLELDQPAVFVPVNKEAIKPEELNLPASATPDEKTNAVNVRFYELVMGNQKEQVRLFAEQIDRLRQLARKPEYKDSLSFLGPQAWNFVTELPPQMQTSALWDLLNQVAEIKGTLDSLDEDSNVYPAWRQRYDNALAQLGLNTQHAKNLRRYGQFVPLYYRMMVGNLIVQAIPPDRMPLIQNKPLLEDKPDENELTYLYSLLEIKLPFESTEGVVENDLYFAYEELRNLNNLVELSKTFGVQDVTTVYLRGFGYLRQQDEVKKPGMEVFTQKQLDQMDDEIDVTLPPPTSGDAGGGGLAPGMMPGMPPGMMMPGMGLGGEGGEEGGPALHLPGQGGEGGPMAPNALMGLGGLGGGAFNVAPVKPKIQGGRIEGDIGYALPIKITFVSPNQNAWTYMYEVLRAKQMVELHRLQIRSLSQTNPNNSSIEVTATFLMVPKLFETLDSIQETLKGLEPQSGASATTAAALPGEGAPIDPTAPTPPALPGAAPGAPVPGMPEPGLPAAPPIPGAPVQN